MTTSRTAHPLESTLSRDDSSRQPKSGDSLVDRIVDATPPDRDRTVDLLRVISIGVVVLWHWSLSVTHWRNGTLVMPNPIDSLPGGWAITWVAQVMPLFFLVGGYADRASWRGTTGGGSSKGSMVRRRLRRLTVPAVAMVAVWSALELVRRVVVPDSRPVWDSLRVVFVPLWFLAVFGVVIALAPITLRWHRSRPLVTMAAMVAAVVAVDALRFVGGWDAAGWVNVVLVFVAVHQGGYFWRDHGLEGKGAPLVIGGVAALAVATTVLGYPASMVATPSTEFSNMFPPTAAILAVAVLQAGLVGLATPAMRRLCDRRSVWRGVVMANGAAMTVFSWHMTAVVGSIAAFQLVGGELLGEPNLAWWIQRPLWVAAPGILLAGLVGVFGRIEAAGRGS